jgi:hypothetical protein
MSMPEKVDADSVCYCGYPYVDGECYCFGATCVHTGCEKLARPGCTHILCEEHYMEWARPYFESKNKTEDDENGR